MAATSSAAASSRRLRASSTEKWLAQLNEVIGVASRRLFQSQLILRAASERDIRAELPELCAFAASICQHATSSKQRAAIGRALSDPQGQWLSRGAVQSGASGFFCHLLLRETAQVEDPDESSDAAARLVVQILLDPVLKSCYERDPDASDGSSHRACDWRFEKPKYYAMACASLWETLLPFIARAARQHPAIFSNVLDESLQAKHLVSPLVNCRFAQVAGFWRLLGALSETRPNVTESEAVTELQPKVLAFAIQWCVFQPEQGRGEEPQPQDDGDTMVDPEARFYDLLMDKFFQEMHDFLFKCANATTTTRLGFMRFLQAAAFPQEGVELYRRGPRLAAFTASSCLLVKGLAQDVGRVVAQQPVTESNMLWTVGIVSHVDSIKVEVLLQVANSVFDIHDETRSNVSESREILCWIIYIIVCRQQSLASARLQPSALFVRLQERICAVSMEDLHLMPLHWMEIVWKVCFAMSEEEVEAFTEEARASRLAIVGDPQQGTPLSWETFIKRVSYRHFEQYPAITTILGSGYSERLQLVHPSPVQQHDSVIEGVLREKIAKKRRLRRDVVVLSDEQEESRQNALLLPEVMERICTFMSPKRLCRLSLVCKAFATVAKSERVWHSLYVQLVRPLNIKCHHGSEYEHNWRLMCQAKYIAIRKMRNRQREASRKAGRQFEGAAFCWHEDEHELRMTLTLPSLQLCQECGCNQMFATDEAAKSHRRLHQKYRCPETECRALLTSAVALKQHMKAAHPTETNSSSRTKEDETKPTFKCPHDGCTRSYKSAKWLENHIKREHQGEEVIG